MNTKACFSTVYTLFKQAEPSDKKEQKKFWFSG